MPTIGELAVNVTARTGPFSKGLDSANRSAKRFGQTVNRSLSGSLGKLRSALASSAGQMGALFGVGSVGAAVGFGVKLAAEAEQTEVAFTTLLGSADKAKKTLKDLTGFAASTPFSLRGVSEAGKKLIALGTSQKDLLPTMRSIGDIASGLGIPFGELAEIYGKIQVQGRVYAEDINQLQGRGIPIVQALAKSYKMTNDEVKKLVSEGKIGFKDVEQAFKNLTAEGGKFHDLMSKQSETLGGAFSTLKGNVETALAGIGKSISESLDLSGQIKQVNEYFAAWQVGKGPIQAWIEDFKGIMLELEGIMLRFGRDLTDKGKTKTGKLGLAAVLMTGSASQIGIALGQDTGTKANPTRDFFRDKLAANAQQVAINERGRSDRQRREREGETPISTARRNPGFMGMSIGMRGSMGVGGFNRDQLMQFPQGELQLQTKLFTQMEEIPQAIAEEMGDRMDAQTSGAALFGSAEAISAIAKAQMSGNEPMLEVQKAQLAELKKQNQNRAGVERL